MGVPRHPIQGTNAWLSGLLFRIARRSRSGSMSHTPVQSTPERENRIRERAYHLWEADGHPRGRDREYWERAEFLIDIEDSSEAKQLPSTQTGSDTVRGTAIEGFPDRHTGQGALRQTPKTRKRVREG